MCDILKDYPQPIDEKPTPKAKVKLSIHRDTPDYVEKSTCADILGTAIKVIDLLLPYAKGGKIGLFGGTGGGDEHYNVARSVQTILQRFKERQDTIVILDIDDVITKQKENG